MPFNGSGTYVLPAGQPVVTGTVIDSTVFNALTTDVATALTDCVTRDGQSPPTANLPMGSNKITGLANGTVSTDAVNLGQVQDIAQSNSLNYLTSVSGTNTIVATAASPFAAYAAGQTFRFIPANTNTGATTINISSVGAKNVFVNGVAAIGGELVAGIPAEIIYDGTQFHVIGGILGRIIGATESTPYTTYTNVSLQIPATNSIPQITDGFQILSAAITPKSATSRLLIEAEFFGAIASAGVVTGALFQDSTANAIAVTCAKGSATDILNVKLRHEMAAGTTSATTFTVRVGPSSGASNFYINGSTTTQLYGGIAAARLRVTEYA